MAVSIDYSGAIKRITIPQADLTFVSGTFYELDTDAFWGELKALEATEAGIVWQDAQSHNAEYLVAGETYAPKVEIINASNAAVRPTPTQEDFYEIFFSPDTSYSVSLTGSNNNIFDKENAVLANNQVQVLPNNSAGLIITGGTGVTTTELGLMEKRIIEAL